MLYEQNIKIVAFQARAQLVTQTQMSLNSILHPKRNYPWRHINLQNTRYWYLGEYIENTREGLGKWDRVQSKSF